MEQEIGTVALILSAGRGHRIGGETPKQYLPLGGHAILYHTIVAFSSHEQVDVVRVVIHPDDERLYYRAIEDLNILSPVFGGVERQQLVVSQIRAGRRSPDPLGRWPPGVRPCRACSARDSDTPFGPPALPHRRRPFQKWCTSSAESGEWHPHP